MGNGFFGKLPAHGDFVARGLPVGARQVLDRWLTQVLRLCGPAPEDWPPGGLRALIAHAGAPMALLILPSRDAAGREFPLPRSAPLMPPVMRRSNFGPRPCCPSCTTPQRARWTPTP